MFRRTLITLSLTVVAVVGVAGPASAFEFWCMFDPIACAAVNTAVGDDEEVATDSPVPPSSGFGDGFGVGAGFGGGFGIPPLDPGVPGAADSALVDLPSEVLAAMEAGGFIDIPFDVTVPFTPDTASTEETESASTGEVPSGGDDEASADDEATIPSPSATGADEPGPEPQSQTSGADAAAETLATAALSTPPTTTDPMVAALLGGLTALSLALVLAGVFAAGRRSSR